jgi:hypothetical protein
MLASNFLNKLTILVKALADTVVGASAVISTNADITGIIS